MEVEEHAVGEHSAPAVAQLSFVLNTRQIEVIDLSQEEEAPKEIPKIEPRRDEEVGPPTPADMTMKVYKCLVCLTLIPRHQISQIADHNKECEEKHPEKFKALLLGNQSRQTEGVQEVPSSSIQQQGRKRGRPPGSKNRKGRKPQLMKATTEGVQEIGEDTQLGSIQQNGPKRRLGRPPGSKNRKRPRWTKKKKSKK